MPTLRAIALLVVGLPSVAPAQWTYGSIGTDAELRGLSTAGERIAWASGRRGSVVRSVDGGRSWLVDSVPAASSLDLRAIQALNGGAAVVVSSGEAEKGLATIFATGDGGRHWNRAFSTREKGVFLDAIAFWDVRHGIVLSDPVGGTFVILLTSDGGRTWTRISAAVLPRLLPGEAAFAASGSCLVVQGSGDVWIGTGGGGRARVLHSADRGRTWSVTEAPVHADGGASGIFSLAFFDRTNGIAVGGDYTKPRLSATSVALTRDGGRSWYRAAAPPAAYLSGVSFGHSPAVAVAVGLAGTFISKDSGATWIQTDTVPLNAVRFNGRRAFAVGPRGRVAFSDSIGR